MKLPLMKRHLKKGEEKLLILAGAGATIAIIGLFTLSSYSQTFRIGFY